MIMVFHSSCCFNTLTHRCESSPHATFGRQRGQARRRRRGAGLGLYFGHVGLHNLVMTITIIFWLVEGIPSGKLVGLPCLMSGGYITNWWLSHPPEDGDVP